MCENDFQTRSKVKLCIISNFLCSKGLEGWGYMKNIIIFKAMRGRE